MSKKLQIRTRSPKPPAAKSESEDFKNSWEEQQKMLTDIQGKIFRSPALNGGFDAMMFKMESLETASKIQGEKLDSIHEAIFHPDDGLYARVKQSASSELVDSLKQSVKELQGWKIFQDQTSTKDELEDSKKIELLRTHEKQLEEFKIWKERITSVGKWFVVSLAGAMIALVFKLMYEFLKGHIQFV